MERFVKGSQDIEITGNEVKIFLRPNKPVTQAYLRGLVKYLKKSTTIIIPSMMTVIVVSKNGEVKTL